MTLRWAALALAILGVLLLGAAGTGVSLGLWQFRTGFSLLRWGGWLSLAGAGLGALLLGLARFRGPVLGPLGLAVAVGLVGFLVPWLWQQRARRVPPIHDITTDTVNPPEFIAVLPLRANAPNPATYGGSAVAEAQRLAYPDIRPLHLDLPPARAFERALAAARTMGWDIVAADSAAGRIEATATTFWFRFKDDVVVRLTPEGAGTRVDVRSLSRVGRSDVGTNARRIRAYFARLSG
jgi:uncharacterized protein (DUF1499 family)